jgi:hypothetical protein
MMCGVERWRVLGAAAASCWCLRYCFVASCVQPSFELGVLAYEVCTGEHPLPDYPVDPEYAVEDLPGIVSPDVHTFWDARL